MLDSIDRVDHIDTATLEWDTGWSCLNELDGVAVVTTSVVQIIWHEVGADRVETRMLEKAVQQIASVAAEIQHGLSFKRDVWRKEFPILRCFRYSLPYPLLVRIKACDRRRAGSVFPKWTEESYGQAVAE